MVSQVQPREPDHAGALRGDASSGKRLRSGGKPGCAEAVSETESVWDSDT